MATDSMCQSLGKLQYAHDSIERIDENHFRNENMLVSVPSGLVGGPRLGFTSRSTGSVTHAICVALTASAEAGSSVYGCAALSTEWSATTQSFDTLRRC